jgi:pimeloyl-ACP methyl ester carboxylesterase
MTPKLVNDATWNLGLYQGHYTASQREKDLEAMKNNYVDGFNKYFFYQAAFAHNSSEPRDYIFTPNMMTAIDEYAKWYNIEGLTGEILTYVPSSKWMLYRTYWQDMCLKDYRHMLNKITVPTGILYADPGSIYDVRTAMYLKENIINSRCYSIKGAVHTSLITFSTEETFKQISQFLKDTSNNI